VVRRRRLKGEIRDLGESVQAIGAALALGVVAIAGQPAALLMVKSLLVNRMVSWLPADLPASPLLAGELGDSWASWPAASLALVLLLVASALGEGFLGLAEGRRTHAEHWRQGVALSPPRRHAANGRQRGRPEPEEEEPITATLRAVSVQ